MEELFVKYGAIAVFGGAFVEFVGLPFPSAILLLYVGAIVEPSVAYLSWLVLLAALGAVFADLAWYLIGRSHGEKLLGLYCRATLGSTSCTDRTRRFYLRFGVRSLLFAKFVPGFSTFAAPMAGHTLTPFRRFVAWDIAGALVWSGTLLGAGHILGRQLVETISSEVSRAGSALTWLAVIGVAVALAFKIVRLRRRGPATSEQLMSVDHPPETPEVPTGREGATEDSQQVQVSDSSGVEG